MSVGARFERVGWALVLVCAAATVGCDEGTDDPDGSVMDGGTRPEAGGFDPDGGREPPPVTCEDYEFLASGTGNCDEGCSLSCECPDGFPISVASCTPDGCIVLANCIVVCEQGLEASVGCADTYKVPD